MGGLGHFFHFIMMLLVGPWWIPVWVLCALICGSNRRNEELKLLRKIANKGEK